MNSELLALRVKAMQTHLAALAAAVPPNSIEPLKQGVEQFGELAIQLHMKMRTRPGEQFVTRRKKSLHDAQEGFCRERFQVRNLFREGGRRRGAEPAAARQVLTLVKGKSPEESG